MNQTMIPEQNLFKRLWKALRTQRQIKLQEDIDFASTGVGIKRLKQTNCRRRGDERITNMRGKEDKLQSQPEHSCEVFAQFYEDIYRESEGHLFSMPDIEQPVVFEG